MSIFLGVVIVLGNYPQIGHESSKSRWKLRNRWITWLEVTPSVSMVQGYTFRTFSARCSGLWGQDLLCPCLRVLLSGPSMPVAQGCDVRSRTSVTVAHGCDVRSESLVTVAQGCDVRSGTSVTVA